MLTGSHLIAGTWVSTKAKFASSPANGVPFEFSVGDRSHVNAASEAAEAAFETYATLSRDARASFLERIAAEIENRGSELTAIGEAETGLPTARLEGERARTIGQLVLFAEHIRKGEYLDRRIDSALPTRVPLPRPEIRMAQRPLGPVAVFGASNFPLAFSTAGGDTASALAAGCPVVVRGHPAHPGTGEIVAQAMHAAVQATNIHPGVFSFVQGNDFTVGEALVQHPNIKAVGFTGSLSGGRALFNLCAQRLEPIPFFGELGSINPVFLLPGALASRGSDIATGWSGSLTMGAGQFCTKPGLVAIIDGSDAQAFVNAAREAVAKVTPQTMLTDGIANAYVRGRDRISSVLGVSSALDHVEGSRKASPYLFEVSGKDWLAHPILAEEVFGPLGLIVRVTDLAEMKRFAAALEGQLTCTIHVDPPDYAAAKELLPILERKAGRVLANGFPTGVEVGEAQVHGGPYPASTNFGATSVGTLSIRRWLRPVAFQNLPTELVPFDV
ncbi:MAG: aldehyde dehydrogenase (NADP(+)) [Paracoccaceae bacterium]